MSATITFQASKYSAPITISKTSKLAKRGITGGINYDIAEIPENVCQALLVGAIEDFVRQGLKNANLDAISQAECQSLMRDRLELLKSGSLTTTRKVGKQDPVRMRARKAIRQMFSDASEVEIAAKDLTAKVSALFKLHAEYLKKSTSDDRKAELQGVYDIVQQALDDAREAEKKQAKLAGALAALSNANKAAPSATETAAKPAATAKKKTQGQTRSA